MLNESKDTLLVKHGVLVSLFIYCLWMLSLSQRAYALEMNFTAGPENMVLIMRGFFQMARIGMAFFTAITGMVIGVSYYMGKGDTEVLYRFFLSTFFVFGATAIVDAIMAVTLGSVIANIITPDLPGFNQ